MSPEIARQWVAEFFVSPGLALLIMGLYALQWRLANREDRRHLDNQNRLATLEAHVRALERERGRDVPWPETR